MKGGCEAAIHTARRVMSVMSENQVLVKLDFRNAFNSIHRDARLECVASRLPELYRFCYSAYGNSTSLQFGSELIQSAEGVQQGDPLGPLLFCLVIHPILSSLTSPFKIGYMDDVTIGGNIAMVARDVETVSSSGITVGLDLNATKCEHIYSDSLLEKVLNLSFATCRHMFCSSGGVLANSRFGGRPRHLAVPRG